MRWERSRQAALPLRVVTTVPGKAIVDWEASAPPAVTCHS